MSHITDPASAAAPTSLVAAVLQQPSLYRVQVNRARELRRPQVSAARQASGRVQVHPERVGRRTVS
jgi:hypothetical protein